MKPLDELLKIVEKQSQVIAILFTIQEIMLEEMDNVPENAIELNRQAVEILQAIKESGNAK